MAHSWKAIRRNKENWKLAVEWGLSHDIKLDSFVFFLLCSWFLLLKFSFRKCKFYFLL